MNVYFGQVYVEAGVEFGFSHHFQEFLSDQVTKLVTTSTSYVNRFGGEYELMFNISAKEGTSDNQIVGPTVFKRTKDVEYTIYLPFDTITRSTHPAKCALNFLISGVCDVFTSLDIDTTRIIENKESLIAAICADNRMFVS